MTAFTVDPEHSTVTVLARPQLVAGPGPLPASVTGEVEIADSGTVTGSLVVTLDDDDGSSHEGADRQATIDLDGTTLELGSAPDGRRLLQGRADRAATAFGLTGSPLLNPTLQLRWRLVLQPR